MKPVDNNFCFIPEYLFCRIDKTIVHIRGATRHPRPKSVIQAATAWKMS
jgi:hypothetical protein